MRLGLALLVSACLAIPAAAQDKPKPIAAHPKVDQEKVDKAIQEGCKYLLASGGMGTFTHGQRNQPAAMQAYAELILLTLLHSGYYAEGDPALQPLVDFVITKQIGSTYTASLMAMALQKLNPKKYQERIAHCAQFLCDNQCENGQWDYGEPAPPEPPPVKYDLPKRPKKPDDVATGSDPNAPKDPNAPPVDPNAPVAPPTPGKTTAEPAKKGPGKTAIIPRIPVRKRKPGPPNGDNSNSQYAALGLRACLDANIDVDPSVLDRARKWWNRVQNSDGGWGYNDHGNQGGDKNETSVSNDSYGSMTVGATGALCIYDYYMGIPYKTDNNVLKGLDWLGKNFDVTKNPNKTRFAYLYYLYGMERVGMLYGTDRLGAHEWYPEGANHLLTTQNGGAWGGGDNFAVQANTCFAILFLRRGTLPLKPNPTVATGGPSEPRPGVPNGAPVANGGGNRDPGLVANKSVETIAPGWRLLNCKPELQKVVAIGGKDKVLQITEEAAARPPTFRRMVDATTGGPKLCATVGHKEGEAWSLIIKVEGQFVATKPISADSCKDGWTDVTLDLSSHAGKSVLVELISTSADNALWASVSLN